MSSRARKISTIRRKQAVGTPATTKRPKAVLKKPPALAARSKNASRGQMEDLLQQLQATHERFHALARASTDVVYRMSADWKELRHLAGRDFIANL